MKSCEEVTRDLLARRDQYRAEQKIKRKKALGAAASLACLTLAAALGVLVWQGGRLMVPPLSAPSVSSVLSAPQNERSDSSPGGGSNPAAASSTGSSKAAPAPSAASRPPASSLPSALPSSSPVGGITSGDSPSGNSGQNPGGNSGGNPLAEHATQPVSYSEAKALFGYPIVECLDENFEGYSIGVVSQNGSVRRYSEVVYTFTNGFRITLFNQSVAVLYFGGDENYAKKVDYRGHTFWVDEHASADDAQFYIRIGYFPTQDSGLCYVADVTNEALPQTDVLNAMLRLEIQ